MPDIDDVFNYVMNTPDNTNPNVLRSMLNNLEGGGGGGVLVVTVTIVEDPGGGQRLVCDKTTGQIINAIQTGGAVFSFEAGGRSQLASFTLATFDGEIYELYAGTGVPMIIFHASSLDDYPDSILGG